MDAAQGPSRRGVLAGVGGTVAALVLGGCTNEPEAPPRPDPDELLRDAAIAREQSLLAAYDAVLLTQPALTARLLPLREEHLQHLTELRGPQQSASESPQPTATGSPPAVPAVPAPETTTAALAALAAAESDAAATHSAAALAADARPLAVLLASVSASEQSHPVALA